jgi:uncharacterized caspase-like protein
MTKRHLWIPILERCCRGCVLLLAVFASAHAQAPLDVRVALVIGNSAYAGGRLANPANDGKAMAEALRSLGFTVLELRDASRAQMVAGVAKLRDALSGKQGVGMLYYAGHGMQLDWRNYMVPVDARLVTVVDVPEQTVDVNSVIAAFKAASSRMNIIVLDACRDNPFAGTASSKGLAQVDAPPGSFLAFATAPGHVADDGEAGSANGLYTQYLLQELKRPEARIEDIFKRVRLSVRLRSGGRQIPWESTSLEEDFYFQQPKGGAAEGVAEAQARFDAEAAAWDKAKQAGSAAGYAAYLGAYPSGHFSEMAQARMDRLEKPAVVAEPRAGDTLANSTTTERFRLGDVYTYDASGTFGNSNSAPTRTFRVTAIKDDLVEINQGHTVFDRLGNVQSRRAKQWHDAQFFPAEYAVGKKWSLVAQIETNRGADTVKLQARVVGRERIAVRAGQFDVFRIEIAGSGLNGRYYAWTYWMNPQYGMPIKSVDMRRNERGRMGKQVTNELAELHAQR